MWSELKLGHVVDSGHPSWLLERWCNFYAVTWTFGCKPDYIAKSMVWLVLLYYMQRLRVVSRGTFFFIAAWKILSNTLTPWSVDATDLPSHAYLHSSPSRLCDPSIVRSAKTSKALSNWLAAAVLPYCRRINPINNASVQCMLSFPYLFVMLLAST